MLTLCRKTGAILKDTGVRDEHGLEPIDGIFSSPEKSPLKRNGIAHNSTITEDETMDLGESMSPELRLPNEATTNTTSIDTGTIPEPTEVLNGHRNGRTTFPPPRSRSPIKTHLNSAPRRSLGPMSSPSRPINSETPTRAASHPPNRKLLFGSNDPHPSVERSPQKGDLKRVNLSSGKKGKKRPFDLSLEDDEEDEEVESILQTAETTNGNTYDDTAPLGVEDDSVEITQANDDLEETEEQDPQQPEQDQSPSVEPEPAPEPVANTKKRRGRPSKPGKGSFEEPKISVASEKPAKKAGRPFKKAKTEVFQDKDIQDPPESSRAIEQGTPAKKKAPIQEKKTKASKPAPSLRDPNAKIKATPRTKEKSSSVKPMPPPPQRNGRPQPRSLQILRSETPADDEGARTTRAGRHSVKPLAFWRGERFIYGEGHLEGKELTLPAIKEIIRTEDIEVPRPKRPAYRRNKPHQRRQLEDLEEEDDESEPWETETGIVRAQVMQWDPMTGRGDEERMEEAGITPSNPPSLNKTHTNSTPSTDVAYAYSAIEMRDINNSDFRFAKTLTLPFFGSGMVDLPPGVVKRVKNSRKMQMIFFVFEGRVTVDMGTPLQGFSIGRGGMWQVPRGEVYLFF